MGSFAYNYFQTASSIIKIPEINYDIKFEITEEERCIKKKKKLNLYICSYIQKKCRTESLVTATKV